MNTTDNFETFCGGQFWNETLTWNTQEPDFTSCFQNTVLVWIPCAFLWIVSPFYACYIYYVSGVPIPVNKLNTAKTLVGLILIATSLLNLIKTLTEYANGENPPAVLAVSPAVELCSFILAVVFIQLERIKGFITSGVLFLFWVLLTIAGLVPFYSKILNAVNKGHVEDVYRFTIFYIYYIVLLVQLVLSCIVETPSYEEPVPDGKEPCPESHACFLSRVTFNWMNSIVLLGYKKTLEEKDLWALHPRDITQNTAPKLEKAWKEELRRCGRLDLTVKHGDQTSPLHAKNSTNDDEKTPLLATTVTEPKKSSSTEKEPSIVRVLARLHGLNLLQAHLCKLVRDIILFVGPMLQRLEKKRLVDDNSSDSGSPRASRSGSLDEKMPLLDGHVKSADIQLKQPKLKVKDPSLLGTLARSYGFTLFQAHLCKLVCDILIFVGPMLQSELINFTEDLSQEVWKGYFFAVLFFLSAVLNSFFFHQLFHIGMTLGMRIKASTIAAVYKKALTMSNEGRKTSTVGEIVNLMSVDAQRLQDVTGYLWMVWSCPLQIAIAIYMLWGIVGPSVLAGLAVMILLIPINGVLATYQRKLQIAQMTLKDQRIKLMNEVLNGMKVLKLYAWELSFKEKINHIREQELKTLKQYAYLSAIGTFTWTCAPFIVTLATFATFVLVGGVLDAEVAFVSLSLFNILRFPITLLPMMISYIVTASVSIKRLGNFLQTTDLDEDNVQHDTTAADPIIVKKGSFAWGTGEDDMRILKNINLSIKDGSLVAVVGPVGAGKSSLISSFLGEMDKFHGHVNLRGSVAYVAQQAWIQNTTLKENIIFGQNIDEAKYQKVLEACALGPDLEILPGGDLTEIGEKGINLSGGQKQRVSLARAVYMDSDIYLLDDPLSAVDSHVGKHIFENVISDSGMLKGKTRVLVTHGVHWLPKVDRIVVISNGEISEVGTYEELMTHNGAFAQFLRTYLLQDEDNEEDSDPESEDEMDPEIQRLRSEILERVDSVTSDELTTQTSRTTGISSEGSQDSRKKTRRQKSRLSSTARTTDRTLSKISDTEPKKLDMDKPDNKLIQAETSEAGQVKWAVFFAYCKALGLINAILIIVFFLLYQASSVASNIWLSVWTEDPILKNASIPVNSSLYVETRDLYLGIYGGLGIGQALFVLAYALITAFSMVQASRELHNHMLINILRSPMAFFDTTPIGRILNRFSRDIETIDNILPQLMRSWMNTFFTVISTIIVISYSTPIFLSIVLPLGVFYYFVQRFYIPTSRQLKRIESTSRSPIYVHFSETITGASTIRAYRVEDRFMNMSDEKVDHNLAFYFAGIASNRWIGFRLEIVGAVVVLAAAIFAVVSRGQITGGLVGLSISYALQITQSLNWMVRMTSDLETNVVSVERVKEYSETPTESEWYNDDTKPGDGWPDEGKVSFKKYSTRYRPTLDLVLKTISFDVKGGEKVGIVGRTGAGKSSMTLSLFRIIEAAGGSIVVDNIPISGLGLHHLRSKLTILPQDPVLFSGSLRMNLDPFDKFTDDQLWEVLEHAHLKDFVTSLPAKLEYECGEGGVSLSVGQRQLVCLARTLLRKTRILILDEATAAVDLETDELIQTTIRREFADCTILTIAHRLNTIMDSDRVMVLDMGRIVEFDTPGTLLKKKDGVFLGMAKDAGLVS